MSPRIDLLFCLRWLSSVHRGGQLRSCRGFFLSRHLLPYRRIPCSTTLSLSTAPSCGQRLRHSPARKCPVKGNFSYVSLQQNCAYILSNSLFSVKRSRINSFSFVSKFFPLGLDILLLSTDDCCCCDSAIVVLVSIEELFALFLFVLLFMSQVNSYGHGGRVSSPNHTFSWASLNKQLTSTLCTYFRL